LPLSSAASALIFKQIPPLSLSLSKTLDLHFTSHGDEHPKSRLPDVRGQVPGGGHIRHDTSQKHRRHGRVRLSPRVQQHRGHDPLLRALTTPYSQRQQPHQGRPHRARHGPSCRQGEGVHRSQQTEGFRRGYSGV